MDYYNDHASASIGAVTGAVLRVRKRRMNSRNRNRLLALDLTLVRRVLCRIAWSADSQSFAVAEGSRRNRPVAHAATHTQLTALYR